MVRLLFSLLVIGASTGACSKKESNEQQGTLEYFQSHLKADMSYTAIIGQFGTPEGDIGSGIHIYVYRLTDGTSIWIGYSDHIHYARHMDANNQVMSVLI